MRINYQTKTTLKRLHFFKFTCIFYCTAPLFVFFFLAVSAYASDFLSPRQASLGGAGHAAPLLNDATYQNSSYIYFLPVYSFSGNYNSFSGTRTEAHPLTPGPMHGRNYSVSIQDGRSPLFQAGAAYMVREDASFINAGAAKAISKNLSLGVGGKFYFKKDDNKSTGNDFNGSTSIKISDWLNAAVIVKNVFNKDGGKELGLYRTAVLGTKVNIKGVSFIYLDPHYTFSPPENVKRIGFNAGLETTGFKDLFIRAGYFRESLLPHEPVYGRGFSVGAGWISPRISFDYALTRTLSPSFATTHHFGMTVYF